MLLQFNFKNFKSFRDDTTLDLTATKMSEYSERVISIGRERILPVAAIFGANAHGKSNVLDAFRYMSMYVINSFGFGGNNDSRTNKFPYRATPFLFDENSRDAESSFEVYFIDSEKDGAKIYNYGFTVNNEGVNEEWLNYSTKSSNGKFKKIFYRNESESELDLTGLPSRMQENIKISLQKEALIVSLGAKLKIQRLNHIMEWFKKNECTDFGNPEENLFMSKTIPTDFADDEKVRKNVLKYFSVFDSSIVDFHVETIKSEQADLDGKFSIDSYHRMIGSDKLASIPLERESAGTLKMFALYPYLQRVLETGGVLLIDELNAKLHPLLVRTFLITFLNTELNKNHAQLIFTTHDVWQINSSGLRRDEIWFTEKNSDGISTLYSLSDFLDEDGVKIRKDENYEKNYLLGKYGAVPTLSCFDMFEV